MRKILIKVWQGDLTPSQALQQLVRAGPPNLAKEERKRILEILSALQKKEIITVNEAEEELEEEGIYENRPMENLCQIC